ncbi:SigB/SigF/SigG family RNA polymerase sigma factor [Streptomyces sp. NPDC059215]|uniref:SigB/SigF/SigG family RNA polymerase sigma factor n=1 Tax=Streptomyces sp. NPDC059215 TaxID=3346772 RepID=UPI00369AF13A
MSPHAPAHAPVWHGAAGRPGSLPEATPRSEQQEQPKRSYPATPEDSAALFAHLVGLEEGAEREVLRDELVALWLPMAHRVAGRFRNRGEDIEDLRQVAAVGLVKAMDRYDQAQGPFEVYAVPTITGEIKRHFRDRTWALRVPRRTQELRNKVRTARKELADLPGSHEPTPASIAAHTGLTEHEVGVGLGALESYSTLSLDAEIVAEDAITLGDCMGETDPSFDTVIDREAAKEGLRHLPEREQAILYLRFFRDMTQKRIGEVLGISQMQVSRLITRSCAHVRDEALKERTTDEAAA